MPTFSEWINENRWSVDEANAASRQKVIDVIKVELEGTNKSTDKNGLWNKIKGKIGNKKELFDEVFDDLVTDEYLIQTGKNIYQWEN